MLFYCVFVPYFTASNNSKYESNVNVVSVYSYSNVSLLNYLLAKINNNVTVTKTSKYEVTDYNLVYTSGVIQKRISIYNAIISAYKKAGYSCKYPSGKESPQTGVCRRQDQVHEREHLPKH